MHGCTRRAFMKGGALSLLGLGGGLVGVPRFLVRAAYAQDTGPRPKVLPQVHQYTPRQRGRLAVEPGITGWAQVSGRAALPWHERIELDLWYLEHRSWRLDLLIMWRTLVRLVSGRGLY